VNVPDFARSRRWATLRPAVILWCVLLVGLALGTVRLRTRSLYPCMVIHMAWNSAVLLRDLMNDGVL